MADILIKNMEMPRGNNVLVVDSAGTITKVNRWTGEVEVPDPFSVKAVALPEHGDLKDANAILRWLNAKADNRVPVTLGEIIDFIEKQHIIVEATNG